MSHRYPQHNRYSASLRAFVLIAAVLAPLGAAQAYVGPGAGLSLVSALWGLLCAIGAALLFVIVWPIRRLRRKRREARQANSASASASTSTPASHSADTSTASRPGSHNTASTSHESEHYRNDPTSTQDEPKQ